MSPHPAAGVHEADQPGTTDVLAPGRRMLGFVLLELLVIVIVLGVVAAIAVPQYLNHRAKSRVAAAVSDARQAGTMIEDSWAKDRAYPEELDVTGSQVESIRLSDGNQIARYSRASTGDSFAVCIVHYTGITAAAWAVYDSSRGGVVGKGEGAGPAECVPTTPPTEPSPTPTAAPSPSESESPSPSPSPTPTLPDVEYDAVSMTWDGRLVDYPNTSGMISDDGVYVLFKNGGREMAENVSARNRWYLRNRLTGEVTAFDRIPDGSPGTGYMYEARMTPSASHVSFVYQGQDLLTGGSDSTKRLYVWERATNTLDRIDAPGGTKILAYSNFDISADGRYVLFTTNATNLGVNVGTTARLVRYDRQANTYMAVDHAPDGAPGSTAISTGSGPKMASDGQYVAFMSPATNLNPNATNGLHQVFRWAAATDTVTLVSAAGSGTASASSQGYAQPTFVSDDGRHVAWTGKGPDITGISDSYSVAVSRNMDTGTITIVSKNGDGTPAYNSFVYGMTPNGATILFASGSGGVVSDKTGSASGWHAYLWTRATETNRSVDRRDRAAGNLYPSLSTNARFVVFESAEGSGYPDNAIGNNATDIIAWDGQATTSTP